MDAREPITPAKHGGRNREVDVREVMNGVRYVLETGCQWRAPPCISASTPNKAPCIQLAITSPGSPRRRQTHGRRRLRRYQPSRR